MQIIIIDYGIGNVQSIINVLNQFKDFDIKLSSNEDDILKADGVILPGVGAFKKAMEELDKRNLPTILSKYIQLNKPFLGICLGMQLLFESSEEFGITKGLGLIKGKVVHFPNNINDKLPHVSWNEIYTKDSNWDNTILKDIENNDNFYFVHSYICTPSDKNIILSMTEYGDVEFCSSIKYNNIYACQFHPEKSSQSGIKVMNNFIDIVRDIQL